MSDLTTLAAMAQAATEAGRLMPPNLAPGQFDTWPDFKAAFDQVDGLLGSSVRARLDAARPGLPYLDEIDTELPDGEAWVIDAVDGAIQYLQGLPQWSVSIALLRDGEPVLAALYSPFLDQLYTATRGGGAFRDGVRVSPSIKSDLALTLVGTSQPPFPARQPAAITATGRAMALLLPAVGVVKPRGRSRMSRPDASTSFGNTAVTPPTSSPAAWWSPKPARSSVTPSGRRGLLCRTASWPRPSACTRRSSPPSPKAPRRESPRPRRHRPSVVTSPPAPSNSATA
jgi:myo-inositol-1(or 4)-monophosphatase